MFLHDPIYYSSMVAWREIKPFFRVFVGIRGDGKQVVFDNPPGQSKYHDDIDGTGVSAQTSDTHTLVLDPNEVSQVDLTTKSKPYAIRYRYGRVQPDRIYTISHVDRRDIPNP